MWPYNNYDELYHYGIKGMRWGVRRFQDKSGRKRYQDGLDTQRTSEKKSKHRQRLEEQYKQMGLSDKEIQDAVNSRIKAEKVLIAAAAVSVTACAAYAANGYIKKCVDTYIKSGDTLQRITPNANGQLHDVFYASTGKHDNARYEGLLGYTRKRQYGKAYVAKLKAQEGIKVASQKNAQETFERLLNSDPSFRQNVVSRYGVPARSKKGMKKAYEQFNSGLVIRGGPAGEANQKFYNALKQRGYGAVQDINDIKFSGYNAKNPLIIFDNSKNNIMVSSIKELTGDLESNANAQLKLAQIEKSVKDQLEYYGGMSAATLATAAAAAYGSDAVDPREQKN